jgi:hypothetical protein
MKWRYYGHWSLIGCIEGEYQGIVKSVIGSVLVRVRWYVS